MTIDQRVFEKPKASLRGLPALAYLTTRRLAGWQPSQRLLKHVAKFNKLRVLKACHLTPRRTVLLVL